MSSPNIFIPASQAENQNAPAQSPSQNVSKFRRFLTTVAQLLVVITISLLPVLFIAGSETVLVFDRVVVATVLASIICAIGLVSLLFYRQIETALPLPLGLLLLFTMWGMVSGVMQGDVYDSVWGSVIGSLTVLFGFLLVVYMALPLLLQSSGKLVVRALAALKIISALVLVCTALWHWFGFSLLSFGKVVSMNQSLVGTFSDSAVYAGLIVLFGLTLLVMLPLRVYIQVLISSFILVALLLLLLLNITYVWWSIFLASLVTLGYSFLRQSLFQNVSLRPVRGFIKAITAIVFLVALLGVTSGSSISNSLQTFAEVELVEVRPSFAGSVAIARSVLLEDPLLGVGPNRFDDAWRMHKSVTVNQGVFWDTTFSLGHNHVVSLFTTHGMVGGVLFVLFFLSFLWYGVSRIILNTNSDLVLRYVLHSSFIGAIFLWAMAFVYAPSVTILLLAAVLTGLTFAAVGAIGTTAVKHIPIISNRTRGFVVFVLVVLLLVLLGWVTSSVTTKYQEQAVIVDDVITKNDEVLAVVADRRVQDLTRLIETATPESVSQDDLLAVSGAALSASRATIDLDPTEPSHHLRLANVFRILGIIGVSGAYESARESLQEASELDPKNPRYHYDMATLYLAEDDVAAAQQALNTAIDLKFNYTDAIKLQTNIAIANNDVASAVAQVENATKLEPWNPALWYHLGLLRAASNETDQAIQALLRALVIEPSYADARYILALQYVAAEREPEALSQLRLLQESNPNNEQLQMLIENIENGEAIVVADEVSSEIEAEPLVDNGESLVVPSEDTNGLLSPENE